MARPGEKSQVRGVELEPAEMEAAKDAEKLSEVSGELDATCESCHRAYWYPNEKVPEFPANATQRGAGQ